MKKDFKFYSFKYFFYLGFILLTLSLSQFFNGCSGSDEVEEITQRDKDSIEVYAQMQRAFIHYKKALDYNQSADEINASASFESSLKSLNDINYELILKPENYFWKQDYNELAQSVVEDFLTTQSEISQSSLVFEFAKRVSVDYEKIEQVSIDRRPLPEGSDVPLIRNSVVDGYIEFFSNTDRGRSFVDKCLYRSGKYFNLMRDILKYNNAPEELIYLSVQESGLAPTIVSRAGAVGLWQFMPATGYAYGLSKDEYRDDRRDFEKSTDAAARHLKDLYKTFDDWYLAFAAYNAGPGRVRTAINKSGSKDFWVLRGYLPGETKNYVPSILALSFVLRNPEEYGFNDVEYGEPVSYDRVDIQCELSLQKVAELSESDIETIRDLNPELTNDLMPQYDVPYQLRIPHKSFDKFAANYNNATDINKSGQSPQFAGDESGTSGSNIASVQFKVKNYQPEDIRTIGSTDGKMKVTHKFKKKEALAVIAVYYSVRPVDIRIWNDINYGTYPKSKQELAIYVSEYKYNLLQGKLNSEGKINLISQNQDNTALPKETSDIETESEKTEPTAPVVTPNQNTSVETSVYTSQDNNNTAENKTETSSDEEDAFVSANTNMNTPDSDNETTTEQESFTETETNSNETSSTQNDVSGSTWNETTDNSESIEQTETTSTSAIESETTTISNTNNNTSATTYTVSEGDYLSGIANNFGVSVGDLKEWNGLEDDKIMVGQKLKIHPADSKTSIHTVTAGENLTMIASEYGMSLTELKELNDIEDDVIFTGQKLKVMGTASHTTVKTSPKTSGVKKTYTVKKGQTLASIADANDVSIQDLKKWNNLKNDKIMVGQVLKLYNDGTKQKVRKKKN